MYPFKVASGNETSVALETNAGEMCLGTIVTVMTMQPNGRRKVNG